MTAVTHNGRETLHLPDGTALPPGQPVLVPNWPEASRNVVVAEWVKHGVLTVTETEPAPAVDASEEAANVRIPGRLKRLFRTAR
jgi:hypothetical protein